jgi:hypothetical protein
MPAMASSEVSFLQPSQLDMIPVGHSIYQPFQCRLSRPFHTAQTSSVDPTTATSFAPRNPVPIVIMQVADLSWPEQRTILCFT